MQEKALSIRKKILGEEHCDVATSYNDLGALYDSIGNYSQVKEFIEKPLINRKKIFAEEFSDVAASYNDLGTVHFSTCNLSFYLGNVSDSSHQVPFIIYEVGGAGGI